MYRATARSATAVLDGVLLAASIAVVGLWLLGHPPFYSETTPVLSVFTAFSIAILVAVRLLRRTTQTWPLSLSLAMIGLVLGGNVSSILMLTSFPPELVRSFPDVVLTSVMTSVGLILFCIYDMRIVLRRTPDSSWIVDDILIHLALVPGGLSLLGHLLDNPGYLSVDDDPRIGISPLEMLFMGGYAVSAVLSNRDLFLWRFLAAGWANRLVFAGLFVNQFVAPVVVAWATGASGRPGPGLELFVMLGGVVATLVFLLVQAGQRATGPAGSRWVPR